MPHNVRSSPSAHACDPGVREVRLIAGERVGNKPHRRSLRCASYELAVRLLGRRSHVAPQRHARSRCPSSVVPWFTHLCLRKRHRSGFAIASPPETSGSEVESDVID
jgi:hypothetical protein